MIKYLEQNRKENKQMDYKKPVIEDNVFEKLLSYLPDPDNFEKESGGILLGKTYNNKVVITDISEPNKHDKASKYEFMRDGESAQKIINHYHQISNGTINYLGEWHTHYEAHPSASSKDFELIDNLLITCVFPSTLQFIYMLILGFRSYIIYTKKIGDVSFHIAGFGDLKTTHVKKYQ